MGKENKEIESVDDLVLVHMTNYIPENGVIKTPKSAGVSIKNNRPFMGTEYNYKRQRDTVHFAVNHEVSPTTNRTGKQAETKYAIIAPLKDVMNVEGNHMSGGIPVDLYSNGNVTIPEGAYIVCPEQEVEEVRKKVGDNFNILGVEGKSVNGHIQSIIEDLGYKSKTGGDWSWTENKYDGDKDNKSFQRIIKELGLHDTPHGFSKEMSEELLLEDIEKTAIKSYIAKEKGFPEIPESTILSEHSHLGNKIEVFDDDKYLDKFCRKMDKVGVKIPNSIIKETKEIYSGEKSYLEVCEILDGFGDEFKSRNSDMTALSKNQIDGFNKPEMSDRRKQIANLVFNSRVVGEVALSKFKDKMTEKNNESFDELLNDFGEVLFNFTTAERRNQFIESEGIVLSEFESKLLDNEELRNIYMELNSKKDVPFSELSSEDQIKYGVFRSKYMDSFDDFDYRADTEDGNLFECEIFKNDGSAFSKEEINKLGEKCKSNIMDIALHLGYKINDKNTSFKELLDNINTAVTSVRETIGIDDKTKPNLEFTTRDIGKATINVPTEAKIEAEKTEQFEISKVTSKENDDKLM